jgi:diguanylate cyclase (GGDEF)-like protein/PAS domain S-box-containing protein
MDKMGKKKNYRLLIIDDNPAIHDDLKKVLLQQHDRQATVALKKLEESLFGGTDEGNYLPQLSIDSAYQGQDGLQLVIGSLAENNPYALAFVDVRMPPGWDGIETIQRIWEHDSSVQIVICTAHSDYSWNEIYKILGPTDRLLILKKPFDNMEVRQLVSTLTEKWRLTQQVKKQLDGLQDMVDTRTAELQHALSIATTTLESTNEGILVVSRDGKITIYNQRFLELWGIPKEVMDQGEDQVAVEYVLPQLTKPTIFTRRIKQLYDYPEMSSMDELFLKDGRIFERYTVPHRIDGKVIGRVCSFRDITERRRMEHQLSHQSTHDELTGLPNRILASDRIVQLIHQSRRFNKVFALLHLDLDRFKNINDAFGHPFGDLLIRHVAQVLKNSVRETDTVARIGGDEFLIIVDALDNEQGAIAVARHVLKQLKEPVTIEGKEITTVGSIGISLHPQHGQDAETLLRNVDTALYVAKENDPGTFQIYKDEFNQRTMKRFEIESSLFRALERKEFILHYQPIFDVATGIIKGAEALIRWTHPTLGLVSPVEFIPLAEETGLIIPIGEWVIHQACLQAKQWHDQGMAVYISINLSALQLKQQNLVTTVEEIIKKTGIDPHCVEFELTETAIFEQFQDAVDTMLALKNMGIKFAVDDFGTGYSSLKYLKIFPIDCLKVDRSFVGAIHKHQSDVAIILATIAMAHKLGIKVVGEGVETPEQLEFLRKNKCDLVQGFLLSRPIEPEKLAELVQQHTKSMGRRNKKT